MNLDDIRNLTHDARAAVDTLVIDNLHSKVPLIQEIGHYIVDSGGKRLRPLVVLLSALACDYQGDKHLTLAAIIEFIHTATLLHDDVVDESTLRRGNETANALWGDHTTVLVGDFIYSRAFEMMVSLQNLQIMDIMAKTTNTISEGEVLQLLNAKDPDTSVEPYYEVIRCKTAILFAAACQLGGVIANQNTAIIQGLYDYGLNFGITYQLVDDVLDYNSSADVMGKNIGDDLAEGKPTLPLIYVMKNGSETQQSLVRNAIANAAVDELPAIQTALHETGAIDYTAEQARAYANKAIQALSPLPDNPFKTALIDLTTFIIERTH